MSDIQLIFQSFNQVKIGGACSTHEVNRKAYKMFLGKHKGKTPLFRSRLINYKSIILKWILVNISTVVFWFMAPCSLVGGYQRKKEHTATIFIQNHLKDYNPSTRER
jgi:hypothetical protein